MDDAVSPLSRAALRAQLEDIGSRIDNLDADDTAVIDEVLADLAAVMSQLEHLKDHASAQQTAAADAAAMETRPEPVEDTGSEAHQSADGPLSLVDQSEADTVQGIDITRLDIDEPMEAIRADLEWLLTDRYLSLVQQLIGSPTAALSVPELVARNPDIPESTLRSRLTELHNRERPLVIKLEPDVERVSLGYPQKYYAASARAVDLLQQVGLYEGCYRLKKLYEAAPLELPDGDDRAVSLADIESYEHRPVPAWATA
jgi:hypothetical protein